MIDFVWKFEEDCLKNEGEDLYLLKWSFFAFKFAFHNYKELFIASNFDRLCLKNYFEFFQAI